LFYKVSLSISTGEIAAQRLVDSTALLQFASVLYAEPFASSEPRALKSWKMKSFPFVLTTVKFPC